MCALIPRVNNNRKQQPLPKTGSDRHEKYQRGAWALRCEDGQRAMAKKPKSILASPSTPVLYRHCKKNVLKQSLRQLLRHLNLYNRSGEEEGAQ